MSTNPNIARQSSNQRCEGLTGGPAETSSSAGIYLPGELGQLSILDKSTDTHIPMGADQQRYEAAVRISEAIAACREPEELAKTLADGIEAMKDAGTRGELTIKSQQAKDGQLLMSVSDTGVGLLPQEIEQIFGAFFSTKAQGTGMGLPISRSIIESHGARLWATAHSGKGASFHFTLPSQDESGQKAMQGQAPMSA